MLERLAVILAAGQGKRMKSKLYKVLHPVCGKPMVGHVLDTVREIGVSRSVVVVGHGAEAVQSYLGPSAEYALQAEQLGTGHAVKQAKDLLGQEQGTTIVICGDTPLITAETLEGLVQLHESRGAAATILTAELDNPKGYGRVIRDTSGAVLKIVEQKDCSPEEDAVREINTGTYCFDNAKLFAALDKVTNTNAQQEYYLTDVIGILHGEGEQVEAYLTNDVSESIGVNDRVALSVAEGYMRERIVRKHMLNGVTVIDPSSTYIGSDVVIGSDTVLYPNTWLHGQTQIGEDCVIGPQAEIQNTVIHSGATVKHSVLNEAEVGSSTSVGPFAYLRPGAKLGEHVKIGDFVEVKNATIGDHSKVSHLSYVGDAKVGTNVNIGCGAITVNYDGYNKSITEIEDDAFVGSNVNLIAPIKIGKGAYVVAGSTVTHAVPDNDLAIARPRQENKAGYADKIRARAKAKKKRSE
ncbi:MULTISPECIES: bifunctional UDP-N-acetylglucosamine diphosphorylase/glucosamine-1-phosphate N-acetyltransferase GlmU [unclassified Paenibacillus]|uniref:bifunctional UDP-N-acetylglucosamine diphosphorylase/glucosamine-1-phosphate N-acetyltransferase GlmU n=1 Tax=unclassified Paenibacillus TaxID=185978 RepID=UPI0013E91F3C|nr:bifunctional UDP-N-acetylglucosamine diphosphorylase/glucosamine-1-phosphate N-acetyltransferase GlmU [Paenibacillus sp. EKM211P]KAF6579741.1 bifunctional UDP-N-acetylglucosamine diphosphorylase/glucosamine-1-phosphate N-acetyltransferase GlmU [Paenibacillus sp. EKM211P]MCV9952241.1 bifunctional UDP-N-acetylglucosamine diphosphorylase/glucosamine-1-phosphate N-acetyltransferase GlmU [Paenibacillus sp. BT-177]